MEKENPKPDAAVNVPMAVSHFAPSIPRLPANGSPRPFWSVMIPAYNSRADYLAATLRSVLQQAPGPADMQIEVIDDCSPNGPPMEWVRRIAGDRVIVTREPLNLGLAGIWNRCIERAQGQWIHILHQDDLVLPGFYQALRQGAESFPDTGAAFCRFCYIDGNGHWQHLGPLEQDRPGLLPDFLPTLIIGEHIQCAAIVVKRSTYESTGGFNPNLTHALDWEMWIRIANRFPIYYEPAILACWRRHTQATTSKQMLTGENIRDIARAIRIWRSYVPGKTGKVFADRAFAYYANAGLGLARSHLNQNNFKAFRAQLFAALSCRMSTRLLVEASRLSLHAGIKYAGISWAKAF